MQRIPSAARPCAGFVLAATVGLSACFETGEGLILPDEEATLVGRVEQVLVSPEGDPPAQAEPAATVEAVSVAETGSVTVVAEAVVEADGSYRIVEVPAGRTRIQVIARSGAGSEVGRAPLHGETVADTEHVVAPIIPETTVEGRVLVQLRSGGAATAASDRGSVGLLVHMDDGEASVVVASVTHVATVAEAFVAAQAYLETAAQALSPGLTADARAELMAELALEHAASRHSGTPRVEAHDAMAEAVLDGWLALGADAEAQVGLTAARARGLAIGAATGSELVRLALLRQGATFNLRARERLAASVAGAPAASAVAGALAGARAAVDGAADLPALGAALEAGAETASAALLAAVLEAGAPLDPLLQAEVEAAFAGAVGAADLAAHLAPTTSAEEAAAVVTAYRAGVDEAVATLVTLLPGAGLEAEGLAALLVAAHGAAPLE